ncbi:MAG: hypothetical protein ACREIF_11545 [Chthoniobacterales bacterium]
MRLLHMLKTAIRVLSGIALFVLVSMCYSSTLPLVPSVVFNGAPLETDVRVQITEPDGWVKVPPIGNPDFRGPYSVVVYSPRPEPSFPVIELEITANVKPKVPFKNQLPPQDPKGTIAVGNMETAAPISSIKRVEYFDGKHNGRLALWRAHNRQYDVYVTIVVSGNVWVDLCLRCDDPKLLKTYLKLLKDEARSVRITRDVKG